MYLKKTSSHFILMMTFCITLSICLADSKKDKEKDDIEQKLIDCTITRKCSTSEDIVWSTDGKQCYLFRNPCIFATEMCMRRAKNKNEYEIVTEDECKKYCKNFCTDEYAPVCGEYDNAYKRFANECEFYRHSCQNNQSYIFLHYGDCEAVVA